jgi:hypothetical protein
MQKLYNRTTNFVGYSVQIGQFSSNSIDIVLKGFMTRLGISTNNHGLTARDTVHIHAGLTNPGEVEEIFVLYRLKIKIKVALFLFASRSFLANNFRYMVKLIHKAVVIHLKIHKNKRKKALFKQ